MVAVTVWSVERDYARRLVAVGLRKECGKLQHQPARLLPGKHQVRVSEPDFDLARLLIADQLCSGFGQRGDRVAASICWLHGIFLDGHSSTEWSAILFGGLQTRFEILKGGALSLFAAIAFPA